MNSDTNKSPEPYDATSNSPPNKKPLFHPKGYLTRALWSDQSVLYQESPPVWDNQGNCRLAAKLESLLKTKQQKQDAQSAACPKLAKLFGENLEKAPGLPSGKKLEVLVTVVDSLSLLASPLKLLTMLSTQRFLMN